MENLALVVAVAAGALVIWWLFKKVFKLAVLAGIIGVVALIWFFFIR